MADIDHDHQQDLVVDFVKDAVVSNPDSPRILAHELRAAGRSRVVGKRLDRSQHPAAQGLFQAGDYFGGPPGDLDPVSHDRLSAPSASATS